MNTEAVTLEGEVVTLVPFAPSHVEPLAEIGRDERVWRHLVLPMSTLDETRAWAERIFAEVRAGTAVAYTITERATGRLLGATRFLDMKHEHRGLEIGGTWLTPSVWRTRVNTECKLLLLRRAFDGLGCVRVQLKTDKNNEQSRRAIERIGASFEGIVRQNMIVRAGVLRDSALYSIIDREWPGVRERLSAMCSASAPQAEE